MLAFLKKLFGGSSAHSVHSQSARPILNHPSQLRVGDMIALDNHFGLPEQLRHKQLEVTAINRYQWQGESQVEWQLKGLEMPLYLSLETDDEPYLCFSLKINRAQVDTLFDLAQFAQIFEPDEFTRLTLQQDARAQLPILDHWLADVYQQTTVAEMATFYANTNTEVTSQAQGEDLNTYELLSDDESKGIQIEVYANGETDVLLMVYRPLTDIQDYYPSS